LNKKNLRNTSIQQRQALSTDDWISKSKLLCDHLIQSHIFQKAQTVLVYLSDRQEPDLHYLWENCTAKTWGVPRCVGTKLAWHPWNPSQAQDLQPGAYGILEPLPHLPVLEPEQVDLILVPAVACDRRGVRLGYGGGFYDRLLSQPEWADKPTIGIVFEFAFLDELEADPWDYPMQAICTEQGLLQAQR
jgi:5-formyltetrahydrofolate cyclo-ligase